MLSMTRTTAARLVNENSDGRTWADLNPDSQTDHEVLLMKIAEFIQQEIVRKRLEDRPTLVVYDADRRYRDLCLALAGDRLRVVDASEGSIESRETALAVLQEMGASTHPAVRQLLVYVPAPAPMTDEQKQRDLFSLYAEMDGCFPGPAQQRRRLPGALP